VFRFALLLEVVAIALMALPLASGHLLRADE
jgi:hypothetical protein